MNRMIKTVINGKERYLNYSIEIMFEVERKYGGVNNALNLIEAENAEAFDAVRWFAVKMANDGELCRRSEGYDHCPMLEMDDITARMHPLEYSELKGAVVKAIIAGYEREVADDDTKEIDIGLAELNEKKAKAGA